MAELETIKIVSTPDVLGGKPRLAGRRISVEVVAMLYEDGGRDIDAIGNELNLSRGEVHTALSYYYEHRDDIRQQQKREATVLEQVPGVMRMDADDLIEGDLKLVMTPPEIAEAFGITPEAVYQAVRQGTIPHRRSGSTILIRRWDAERRWRE